MNKLKISNVHSMIETYYTDKINSHGATPKGVDWNSEKGQLLRFKQLSQIIEKEIFTIADIGCGYGKYLEYLQSNHNGFTYQGYDLSNAMIIAAKELYDETENAEFLHMENLKNINRVDYSIASGIFNVKMQHNETQWLSYILDTLNRQNEKSNCGFSFNMLTKYSDKEYMRDDLYYGDPLFFFDYCKKNFSRNISLIHDYELYEFTMLVKKR